MKIYLATKELLNVPTRNIAMDAFLQTNTNFNLNSLNFI
jgi:hypothetical protein